MDMSERFWIFLWGAIIAGIVGTIWIATEYNKTLDAAEYRARSECVAKGNQYVAGRSYTASCIVTVR